LVVGGARIIPARTGTVARDRDIIVIGSPVGGAAALTEFISDLPPDLEASLFVVLHTTSQNPILLADVLNDTGGPRAALAIDGEPIERRRIYVAPNHAHLLVEQGKIRLSCEKPDDPIPSIDRLFVSAAENYGERVIAVLLLRPCKDGIAGLRAVHAAAGFTIVQRDPQLPNRPGPPMSCSQSCNAHLALEEIGPRVLYYFHGGYDRQRSR
jgi:two-component system, chemotaxis family, protein-glutamate methylesterase/glutaminase